MAQRGSLLEAEERTRLILDSADEGVFGVDTEGRITFMNPAAHRMLGTLAEEVVGRDSHEFLHHHRPDGSVYPHEECPMLAAYRDGTASRIDDEYLWRKDGSGFAVDHAFLRFAKEITLCHHETSDGSGYPRGRRGEAIPLSARLMARADVYDALVSRRVYKGPMTHEEATAEIVSGRGSHFDPDVVDAFTSVAGQFVEIARSYGE